jgi:TonB family protein
VTGEQYQQLFGDDDRERARLAEERSPKRRGRFTERLGRLGQALENFIPEVRPGNQTALNTRAAPFAVFIARMHRSIHELWGFGFLEDLNSKPTSNPFNDPKLWTKVEIVLNGDGSIDKVGVIKSSGYTPFDAAAVDVVWSAGPYPDPPAAIRSGNGKIYVHWSFHRDDRQCATSGADYFILDNGGSTADANGSSRGLPMPGNPNAARSGKRVARSVPDSAAHRAKRRELDQAAGGPEEPDAEANKRVQSQMARSDDPEAKAVAQRWFDGFSRGDIKRMLGEVRLPFRSSGGVAAQSSTQLKNLFLSLIDETASRQLASVEMHSPAGARAALGGVPSGFETPEPLLFAVGNVGGEAFVLVLGRREGHWKAVGLVRR